MLTCKELTEIITDYLEGRLSFMDRLRFQMHIGMCRHCRAYLRQMKLTVATMGRLPDEPIPPETRDALLARFRDWKKKGS
ncbi:MAG: zf-HC2 domain-containing protein [Myxococcota bacterium]